MKVDFFNGALRFEGSVMQLKQLVDMLPDLAPKLEHVQNHVNDSIVRHQRKMLKLEKTRPPIVGQSPNAYPNVGLSG